MWHVLRAGGPVMIPILLCSVIGLAVIIERMIVLRRQRIVVPELRGAVESLDADADFAVTYATIRRHPGAFANIIRAGLDHAGDDWLIIRDALQESGRQEALLLLRNLGILETVAAVSPLLGLLGTVIGMIRLFTALSVGGAGHTERLAGGISMALITTAAGLIIGIPALFAHNWLLGRAQGIAYDLEVYAAKILDTLRRRKRPMEALVGAGGD
jgi:biopolymer transport protein ExbB